MADERTAVAYCPNCKHQLFGRIDLTVRENAQTEFSDRMVAAFSKFILITMADEDAEPFSKEITQAFKDSLNISMKLTADERKGLDDQRK